MNFSAPDLTQHPPRSARVRLGGYVILPRMLDKGRAAIAGKPGDYHFGCPLDQRFLQFTGLNVEDVKAQLSAGKTDNEILTWMESSAKHKHSPPEIAAWSAWQEQRAPSDAESRAYFNELHTKVGAEREDIANWFDLLDLDDYVSYGGKP